MSETGAGENGTGGGQQGAQHRDGGRVLSSKARRFFLNVMPHDAHGKPVVVSGAVAGALFVLMLLGFVVESELTQVCTVHTRLYGDIRASSEHHCV